MKKILMRYDWKGRNDEAWLVWMKKRAEAMGLEVDLEQEDLKDLDYLPMPKPTLLLEGEVTDERGLSAFNVNYPAWVIDLQETYGIPPQRTTFVPADPGTLTLLRYFEKLAKTNEPALLVAGSSRQVNLVVMYSGREERLKQLPEAQARKRLQS